MTKKCIGCGALLQTVNSNLEGYVPDELISNTKVCQRCFRIKNYGDYKVIKKDTNDYKKLFDNIKNKGNLILYVCDVLSIDDSINELNFFNGPVILVVTKMDLLPKSVKEKKLYDYIKRNYNLNVKDVIFVSGKKNYNVDFLLNIILKLNKKDKVYLVGNTNAGKSTLINAFIKAKNSKNMLVTTSFITQTTLDTIEIKIDDELTLVDTPGIVSNDSFLVDESPKVIKEVSPKSEIKPRTYQMKSRQSVIIGDYARFDYLSDGENSFTFYLSNDVKVRRININTNDYLRNLNLTKFDLNDNNDIVIKDLCFCKITKKALVNVYVKANVKVYNRKNLI